MVENKYCTCGEPINVEHDSPHSYRTDGLRFYHPSDSSTRLSIFRCIKCKKYIKYDELLELGKLPIQRRKPMERTQRIRKAKDALNIPDIIKIEREGEYMTSVTIQGATQPITVSAMGMQIDLAVCELIKGQLKESENTDVSEINDMIGKKFFFRTVTYHIVGKVEKVIAGNFLKLSSASWVADSGRFMQAIKEGVLDEVEPVGTDYVNLDSCSDFLPWNHDLPKDQK